MPKQPLPLRMQTPYQGEAHVVGVLGELAVVLL